MKRIKITQLLYEIQLGTSTPVWKRDKIPDALGPQPDRGYPLTQSQSRIIQADWLVTLVHII